MSFAAQGICHRRRPGPPLVVGRKNWLFSDTVSGAIASATWYSIMETAKANVLEPYHYLKWVFEELPLVSSDADIEALQPWNIELVTA